MGFGCDILYDRSLSNMKKLRQSDYQRILDESIDNLLIPGRAPMIEKIPVAFPINMTTKK